MSTNKFNLFLENARFLSDKLGIVPLLYGSLGLEYLTGDALSVDDIDSVKWLPSDIEVVEKLKDIL